MVSVVSLIKTIFFHRSISFFLILATVDGGPVQEVTHPCNGWKTHKKGIMQQPKAPASFVEQFQFAVH